MVTRNNPNPVRESSLLGIGPYRYANMQPKTAVSLIEWSALKMHIDSSSLLSLPVFFPRIIRRALY